MERYKKEKERLEAAEEKGINLFPIKRQYKNIGEYRILENDGIERFSDDEVFVRIADCPHDYISSYGRFLKEENGEYKLIAGEMFSGRLCYMVSQNVLKKGVWVTKKKLIAADKLVVQEFVVNPDCTNGTKVFHLNGDKSDCYYKNLYILNKKQYAAVEKLQKVVGSVTEDDIIRIMNLKEYSSLKNMNKELKPRVCDLGYHGCDNLDSYSASYKTWRNMMNRVYNENTQLYQRYDGCTVCREWYNYANFRKWWNSHFYKLGNDSMALDKDIVFKGNLEYSPSTCAFVPYYVNNSVLLSDGNRGELPVGVKRYSDSGKYCLNSLRRREERTLYDTPEEAFAEYKRRKEENLHNLGEKMRGKIPEVICNSLASWQINITD